MLIGMARAGKPYATPGLARLGSVRDVTSASSPPAGPKGGNSIESNVGGGGGDLRRP